MTAVLTVIAVLAILVALASHVGQVLSRRSAALGVPLSAQARNHPVGRILETHRTDRGIEATIELSDTEIARQLRASCLSGISIEGTDLPDRVAAAAELTAISDRSRLRAGLLLIPADHELPEPPDPHWRSTLADEVTAALSEPLDPHWRAWFEEHPNRLPPCGPDTFRDEPPE